MSSPQTSVTHPIYVDFLDPAVLATPGRLGLTIAPGKRADGMTGRWERDLDADLRRLIDDFDAAMLVTLMEERELARVGIGDLRARAIALGLEHVAFPIEDGGVPESIPGLTQVVGRVFDVLLAGRNVVVHCKGGLGRSGVAAAACAIGAGRGATDAIAMVRRAREGAVENSRQERFLAEFERAVGDELRRTIAEKRAGVRPAQPSAAVPRDRVVAALLGGALGDALGAPIEFMTTDEIVRRYRRDVPARLDYAGAARITDDTQMTLWVAEGLIRARFRALTKGLCHPPSVVAAALQRWYVTQSPASRASLGPFDSGWLLGETRLFARCAPGNTNLSALERDLQGGPRGTVERPPNDSKGCGAIMRSAPFLALERVEDCFDLAVHTGVVTHGHPSGYLSAAAFAAILHALARGVPFAEAVERARSLLVGWRGHEETLAFLDRGMALGARGVPAASDLEALGGGWTGESALAIALAVYRACPADDVDAFRRALWCAAAHGGDSDSTAELVGHLAGAQHGTGVLPREWLEVLELRDVIERIAGDLHDALVVGREPDAVAYPPC